MASDAELAEARAALEEAIEERNRLWKTLAKQRADERELAHWRTYAQGIEGSLWWRAGAPLRALKRLVRDPLPTLKALGRRLEDRRR